MAPRKAVPLSNEEISAVDDARSSGVLAQLTGDEGASRSEAAALHALVMLGLGQVKEHSMTTGYAALAESRDDEDRAFETAMRRRTRGAVES
jgi:hypothetical protein